MTNSIVWAMFVAENAVRAAFSYVAGAILMLLIARATQPAHKTQARAG